jgi:putative ABC transport system permease protein
MEQHAMDKAAVAGASFGFAALGLFCTGLIAAAAIGVGARRQLRTLGLVGATGGEPRHVRGIVLWTGTVLGITGSAIGVALAVAVAYAGAPHLDALVGRYIDAVRIPGWILAGALVLGTIAATVAAIGPARHAARLQTVDALAGRTPAPRPPGSLARRGLVAVVGGAVLVGFATVWGEDKLLMFALVPTLGGFLLAIPLLVTWIGRASTYLPTSLRLAARQTGRYGRRTGAAVAAATLALTFPVAVATFSRSDEALANRRAPLAKDQMVLGVEPTGPIIDELPPLPDEVVAAARAAVPGSIVARYRDAVVPIDPGTIKRPLGKPFIQAAVYVEVPPTETDEGLVSYGGALAIGDASLLRAMHAQAGIPVLESGKIVAVGSPVQNAVVQIHFPALDERGEERVVEVPAAEVAGHARRSESIVPQYVISEATAARYGMLPGVPSNAVLVAPHELTDEEIAAVRRAISPFSGAYARSLDDYLYNATAERLVVTAAAAVIALIIVAVAVALVGAESRREHAILVAVGAEPGTRRKMVAANAFLVAALAGVLGAQAGFLPMAVIQFARRGGYPIVVPWFEIGIVALGAPLIAGIVAGVFSREPSNRALLRPVW